MILKHIAVQVVAVDTTGKTHHVGTCVQSVVQNATMLKLKFVADKAARFAASQIRTSLDGDPATAHHD